ncbi:MAG TPA: hypothetical protein VMK12_32695 [Anaeromyxobacteraceae bacterium]|nr:hypothetical protein [Anaeromyxobacteraceae bacterium]
METSRQTAVLPRFGAAASRLGDRGEPAEIPRYGEIVSTVRSLDGIVSQNIGDRLARPICVNWHGFHDAEASG